MNKKIIVILVFILLFYANVITVKGYTEPVEVLDQEQSLKNNENKILSSHIAQSFTPTVNILTKIELYLNRNSESTDYINIGIRESLNGLDLITIKKSTSEIPSGDNYTWIQFDFPDIVVIPNSIYYIIFFGSEDLENPTNCNWGWYSDIDIYYNGEVWLYDLINKNWHQSCRFGDLTFKTYGLDEPPEKPKITGHNIGIIGAENEYKIISTDIEKNNITYYINWGDNTNELFIGPYNSGEEVSVKHTWLEKGNYIIKVKARDVYNVESEMATFKVNILKSKTINIPLFLQRMSNQFLFIEKMLKEILI